MTTNIQEFSKIEAAITQLEDQFNYLPNCSTDSGLKMAKSDYKMIRRYEIDLDKKRKELTEDYRAKTSKVNQSAKDIDLRLKNISAPFKDAIDKRVEEIKVAEENRIKLLKRGIANIQNFVFEASGKQAFEISEIIEAVDLIEVDESFEEFQSEAREMLNSTKSKLAELLSSQLQKEELEEKLAKEREENEKLAKEREAEQEELRQLRADKQEREDAEKRETEIIEAGLDDAKRFDQPEQDIPFIDGDDSAPCDVPCETQKVNSVETNALLQHISEWCDKWELSLEASQELSEILQEHEII